MQPFAKFNHQKVFETKKSKPLRHFKYIKLQRRKRLVWDLSNARASTVAALAFKLVLQR